MSCLPEGQALFREAENLLLRSRSAADGGDSEWSAFLANVIDLHERQQALLARLH